MGKENVLKLLTEKFPEGSGLTIERISDGVSSGGCTWHRNAQDDRIGLRGTLYVELDEEVYSCKLELRVYFESTLTPSRNPKAPTEAPPPPPPP